MKRHLAALLVIGLSCSGEPELVAPANLVPKEKMIPVIVDLQILEAHFQRVFSRPDVYKKSLDSSSNLIFEKYDITRSQFDSSYTWYSQDVNVIYAIYEAALDSVNFKLSQPSQ